MTPGAARLAIAAPARRPLPRRPRVFFRLAHGLSRGGQTGQGARALWPLSSHAAGRADSSSARNAACVPAPEPGAAPRAGAEAGDGAATRKFERGLRAHYASVRSRLWPAPPPRVPTLAELFPYDESPPRRLPALTCGNVFAHVCAYYRVTLVELLSARKNRAITRPRFVAMHLARTLTTKSLTEIGAALGKRDHTTILHGARRIAERLPDDPALARDVRELTRRIAACETPRPA